MKLTEYLQLDKRCLDHKHEKKSEKSLNWKKFSNSLKRKVIDDLSIKENMNYACRSVTPKLPKPIDDVHDKLKKMDIETNRSENVLLVNNKADGMLLFYTIINLIFL